MKVEESGDKARACGAAVQRPGAQGPITREHLVQALVEICIAPGDIVFLHTSMKAFGASVAGGADTVIDASLAAVSPGGTVAVPTHSSVSQTPFRPETASMHKNLGIVPRTLVQRPEARRSRHPTHSVAAIGPDAEWLTEGHEYCAAEGLGSPLDKFRTHPRGKVILYGVGFSTVTLFHVAENLAPAPYVGVPWREDSPRSAMTCGADGALVEVSLAAWPGCAGSFTALEPLLRDRGLIHEARVGSARVITFPAGPAVELAVEVIRKDPRALLSSADHCDWCRRANRKVEARRGKALD